MKTINKTIHLKAFGTSGRMLFTKEKNEEQPEETVETLEQVDFLTMLLELEHR